MSHAHWPWSGCVFLPDRQLSLKVLTGRSEGGRTYGPGEIRKERPAARSRAPQVFVAQVEQQAMAASRRERAGKESRAPPEQAKKWS